MYNKKRFQNYLWNIDRIEFKHWRKFIIDFADEYNKAKSESKVDERLFNEYLLKRMRQIIADPEEYYQMAMADIENANQNLKPYSKVIIYGAGGYGYRAVQPLVKLKMLNKVECFAVTKKGENVPDEILGIPVCCIDEIDADREKVLMVVAVKPESDMSVL